MVQNLSISRRRRTTKTHKVRFWLMLLLLSHPWWWWSCWRSMVVLLLRGRWCCVRPRCCWSWRRRRPRTWLDGRRDTAMLGIDIIRGLHQVQKFERQHCHGRPMIGTTSSAIVTSDYSASHLSHHFESAFRRLGGRVCRRRRSRGMFGWKQQFSQFVLGGFLHWELGVSILNVPPTKTFLASGRSRLIFHQNPPVITIRTHVTQRMSGSTMPKKREKSMN